MFSHLVINVHLAFYSELIFIQTHQHYGKSYKSTGLLTVISFVFLAIYVSVVKEMCR